MKKLLTIPALLLALCLLAACGGQGGNVATTAEITVEPVTFTEAEPTEAITEVADDLLDFALIDRLFSMTYADFCREEGRTVEPEGTFEGSVWCVLSGYGENTMIFFEPDWESAPLRIDTARKPVAVFFDPPSVLVDRQSLTLGELKQWLHGNGVPCVVNDFEENGPMCIFEVGDFAFGAALNGDDVFRITVHCDKNLAA